MAAKQDPSTVNISEFKHGLMTDVPPTELPAGACQQTNNMWLTRSGAFGVRRGVKQFSQEDYPAFDVAHALPDSNGTTNYVAGGASSIHAGTPDNLDPLAGWTAGVSSDWPMVPFAAAYYGGAGVVLNQSKIYQLSHSGSWSLTDKTAAITTPPEGCFLCQHHNLLFSAGDDANPNTIRWSAPGNALGADSWSSAKNLVVGDLMGTPISGIVSYNNALYVFTRHAVFLVQGYDWETGDDLVVQELAVPSGCIAPRSIQVAPEGIFYIGRDGLYLLGRNGDRLSDLVADQFVGRQMRYAVGILAEDLYGICLPGLGDAYSSPESLLVFDRRHRSWTSWDVRARLQFPRLPDTASTSAMFAFQEQLTSTVFTLGDRAEDDEAPVIYPDTDLYPEVTGLYPGGSVSGVLSGRVPFLWKSGAMYPSGDPSMRADIPRAWLTAAVQSTSMIDLTREWDHEGTDGHTLEFQQADAAVSGAWRSETAKVGGLGNGRQLALTLDGEAASGLAVQMLQLSVRSYLPD